MVNCLQCSKTLERRNKSGFCRAHKNMRIHACSTKKCTNKISANNINGLCKFCYDAKWHEENLERVRKVSNIYYYNNKDAILESRRKREQWRWHNDFIFRLKKIVRARFKKAMRENWVSGSFTDNLGCTIPDLKKHLESKFQPGMSWDNYGFKWEIDHIKPFNEFDLSEEKNLKLVGNFKNLQPIWKQKHYLKTANERRRKNVISKK